MRALTARTAAIFGAAIGLSSLLYAEAAAQAQLPHIEPEPTPVDEIIVRGMPLDEQVTTFVDEVTAPPAGRNPARWRELSGVCVGVVNLRRDVAQAMADRVSDVAVRLNLSVGEPGCSPNVVIFATDDAATLTAAMVKRSPSAFRPYYSGAAGTRRDLDRFLAADRPVRWWHVMMPIDSETGDPAVRLPGEDRPRYVRGSGRLGTIVQNVLLRAYVIIDIDQVQHLTFHQLSDYVAMAAFAQIDPEAQIGDFPTILNVIDNPGIAQSMTDWDEAYLGSLYAVEMNRRSPDAQAGAVAGLMLRERRLAQAEIEVDEID